MSGGHSVLSDIEDLLTTNRGLYCFSRAFVQDRTEHLPELTKMCSNHLLLWYLAKGT